MLTNIGKLGKMNIGKLGKGDLYSMNRDEILRKAQAAPVAENEKYVARNALRMAAIVGLVTCLIMVMVELFVFRKVDFGKPFLIALIEGLADVIEACKSKNKRMLLLGILGLIFAFVMLLLYIGELFR